MTYQLKTQESLSEAIKRIVRQEIERSIEDLSDTDDSNLDEAVHQVRKRLKKIRAAIRLIRDRLGESNYKQENIRFRDLARNLTYLRDSKVQIKTLDDLSAFFADLVTPEAFNNIRQNLEADYRREHQRILDEGIAISLQNTLKNIQDEIDNWPTFSDNWSAIESNLKRVYKRGYKSLREVLSEPSTENLHEWRKQSKYVRYQLRILAPIWSKTIEEAIDRIHDLSDYLGEDRDLSVLKEFISNQPERFDNKNALPILTALIDRRREELQLAAISLGKRIYAEKPENFVERLGNYWQIWQEETRQPEAGI